MSDPTAANVSAGQDISPNHHNSLVADINSLWNAQHRRWAYGGALSAANVQNQLSVAVTSALSGKNPSNIYTGLVYILTTSNNVTGQAGRVFSFLKSSSGAMVYGTLSYDSSTNSWTLYFYTDQQVAYTFPANFTGDLVWYYQEIFKAPDVPATSSSASLSFFDMASISPITNDFLNFLPKKRSICVVSNSTAAGDLIIPRTDPPREISLSFYTSEIDLNRMHPPSPNNHLIIIPENGIYKIGFFGNITRPTGAGQATGRITILKNTNPSIANYIFEVADGKTITIYFERIIYLDANEQIYVTALNDSAANEYYISKYSTFWVEQIG